MCSVMITGVVCVDFINVQRFFLPRGAAADEYNLTVVDRDVSVTVARQSS